jgi:spermidine synthase
MARDKPGFSLQLLLNITAFFMAFCSLSYEILIASRLSRICGEGMFYYPAALGIFILFMGLGSTRIYFQSPKDHPLSLQRLIHVELLLSVLGALSILSINLTLKAALYHINLEAFAVGFVFAAAIGYFSGQELPLIFNLCARLQWPQQQIRRIIFFDYLASFFASVMCVSVFFAHAGFFQTSVLTAFVNVAIVGLLWLFNTRPQFPVGKHVPALILVLSVAFGVTFFHLDRWENRLLRRTYIGDKNAALLAKEYTPYQQVLLFAMRKDDRPLTEPPEVILRHPDRYYVFAVLNGTLQFFEPFESAADPDHTFLFDPYIKLLPGISEALILGGGDGLPARQAVRYDALNTITVVDIDEQWVDFARTNPFMRQKNQNALADPRVRFHAADAFQWVPRSGQTFGIIIVDFPSEPFTLAKLRTNSVQFFRDIRRALKPHGAAILHSNTFSSKVKRQLIARTARKAGLYPLYGYKQGNARWSDVEQIVLFPSRTRRDMFIQKFYQDYLSAPKNAELIEQWGHLDYALMNKSKYWISFYDPLVSRLPWPQKWTLLME